MEIVLKRVGVTKKELADRLEMSQPNITKKFKYNDWRESDVVKVCEVIGVECEMIFTMDDGTKVWLITRKKNNLLPSYFYAWQINLKVI